MTIKEFCRVYIQIVTDLNQSFQTKLSLSAFNFADKRCRHIQMLCQTFLSDGLLLSV